MQWRPLPACAQEPPSHPSVFSVFSVFSVVSVFSVFSVLNGGRRLGANGCMRATSPAAL
jgi:hypothetical protein